MRDVRLGRAGGPQHGSLSAASGQISGDLLTCSEVPGRPAPRSAGCPGGVLRPTIRLVFQFPA